jgi:hypothetical protein
MMRTLWRYNRRPVLFAAAMLAVLLLLAGTALFIRLSGGHSSSQRASAGNAAPAAPAGALPTASSTSAAAAGLAASIASLQAVAPVTGKLSAHYPAITGDATAQPNLLATAFITQLFTTDYHDTARNQLLQWAQYVSAAFRDYGVPAGAGSKLLVASLSDPALVGGGPVPVPDPGQWLALGAKSGDTTVTDVTASVDPDWEATLAAGHTSIDPLQTELDVSATLTLHTMESGQPVSSVSDISLLLIEGTAIYGSGYAPLAVTDYVTRTVN